VAAVKPEWVLKIVKALPRRFVAAVIDPTIGLQQDRRTEIAVRVPPIAWTGCGAAGTQDALIESVELLAVFPRLLPLDGRGWRICFKPRLN